MFGVDGHFRLDSAAIIRFSSIGLLLLVWELLGLVLPPIFLSPFHDTLIELWRLTLNGTLVKATLSSLEVLFSGLALSTVIGLTVGLILGRYPVLRVVFEPYVNTLYATPMIAFLPLVTAWLGLYYAPKVVIVVLMAVFPILKNTLAGVANVPRELLEPAESMSATEMQLFAKVIIPAALPFVLAGLRLAIGKAIVGVVVAEFLTAQTGLGGLVTQYAGGFQTARMFAPIVIIVSLGVLLTAAASWLQSKLAPWKETERDNGA